VQVKGEEEEMEFGGPSPRTSGEFGVRRSKDRYNPIETPIGSANRQKELSSKKAKSALACHPMYPKTAQEPGSEEIPL
jgi:hypothetical protein